MDVGIHIRPQGWLAERAHLIALARRAEALDYRLIGVVDHLVLPRDVATRYPYTEDGIWPGTPTGECFDVLGTLCFLAGCTERIGLLSSVMVGPGPAGGHRGQDAGNRRRAVRWARHSGGWRRLDARGVRSTRRSVIRPSRGRD